MSHSSEETMPYTSEGSAPGVGCAACEPQEKFRTGVKIFDIRAGALSSVRGMTLFDIL